MARQDLIAVMRMTEQLMLVTVDYDLLRGKVELAQWRYLPGWGSPTLPGGGQSDGRGDRIFHVLKTMETKV